MPDFGECESRTSRKVLSIKENKCKLVFENRSGKQLRKILVDGCAIKDGIRCDYLVITQNSVEYFIELKGSKIKHAIKQLETTINNISSDANNIEKYAIVISTRLNQPDVNTIKQKALRDFKKKFNAKFILAKLEYSIIV